MSRTLLLVKSSKPPPSRTPAPTRDKAGEYRTGAALPGSGAGGGKRSVSSADGADPLAVKGATGAGGVASGEGAGVVSTGTVASGATRTSGPASRGESSGEVDRSRASDDGVSARAC